MGRSRLLALATAVLVGVVPALLLTQPAAAQDGTSAAEAREWNQRRGNAARTGFVDVEPIRGPPVEAWRVELPEPAISRPVTWGGVVYVATGGKRGRTLRAYRIQTGEAAGHRGLGKGGDVEIVVSQGVVFVRAEKELRAFRHRAGVFQNAWRLKERFVGAPCVAGSALIVRSRGNHVIRIDAGKGKAKSSLGVQSHALPSISTRGGRTEMVGARVGPHTKYVGTFIFLVRVSISIGRRAEDPGLPMSKDVCSIEGRGREMDEADFTVVELMHKGRASLLFTTPHGIEGSSGESFPGVVRTPNGDVLMSAIRTPPAVHGGLAYGFTRKDELVEMDAEGGYRTLVKAGNLPRGAAPGPGCIARSVLMFRNWAADIESGRVLWVLPELAEAIDLIPAGDGRAVALTTTSLIGLADPNSIEEPVADDAPTPTAIAIPRDVDGLVLIDGRQIEGSWKEISGGKIRITPPDGGKAVVIPRAEVACASGGDAETLCDDPSRIVGVWRDALECEAREAFVGLFARFSKDRMVSESRRMLALASRYGLSASEASKLEGKLAGKSEHPNAGAKRDRTRKIEADARRKLVKTFRSGIAWCRARDLDSPASYLLGLTDEIAPADADLRRELYAIEEELRPESFHQAQEPGEWIRWAREIVPAGAEFVPPGNPLRARGRGIWRKSTVVFRTKNVVFFSRVKDPEIVGRCLRQAEGAVRALEYVFGDAYEPARTPELIDVRLHRSREDYLGESGGGMEWSAGYYSPGEGISRFFVKSDRDAAEPLGRGLFKTLAHEITHHWVHRRLMKGGGAGAATPGYWIVEGIAQLVGDQAVEMGRRGQELDDPTVPSIDAAVQVARQRKLIPISRLVPMPQLVFAGLGGKTIVTVDLRNSLGSRLLSERSIFYEESGALAFFLVHKRGADGRKRLFDYLKSRYRGKTSREGWLALGFDSASAMQKDFEYWLAELAR